MKEYFITKTDKKWYQSSPFLVFCGFASGCLVAYVLLPPKQRIVDVPVRVEVPVEVVKYVDRVVEKRVEVPVQVKVPVEVVKYVDRVVEKRVEVPVVVERRVEIPVEKIVYRNAQISSVPQGISSWRRLSNGMSMDQVRNLMGEPWKVTNYGIFTIWDYGKFPNSGTVDFDKYGRVSGWSEP